MTHGPTPPPSSGVSAAVPAGGEPETRAYARRSRSLVAGVWLASLVLTASSWVAAFTLADRDEREAMLRAQRDTGNLARIIAEQTTRAIAGADRILNYVAYDLHRLGGQSALLRDALRNATQDSGLLLQLAYADGKGDLIQTSVEDAPARVNLADREHFRVHKDGTVQGLFISRPVFGRASGKWSIQLSRKVTAPDGRFGGMIVASLDPFYFSRIFDDLDVGRQGIVAIFGQDGILRARSVMNETIIGQDVSESTLFKASRESAQGFLRSVSTVDGVARLSSFRRLDSYPLVVSAGFAEAEFMAETWARQRIYVAGASAATALLLAMALLVTWQSRAQGRAHAALDETAGKLRASKERLRDIAETASDWFWEMDAAMRVTDVSGASDGSVRDPGRLLGRRCDEIALRQPGDEARWAEFRRSLDERRPFRDFEFAVRGPDGAVRIWSMSGKPVLGDDGGVVGYRGSGADVTERRRAERSLVDSEQRYRAMFAAVGQPIVVTDQTAVITGFNPAAEALFGYREGEVVGQNVTVLMPEAQAFAHDGLFQGYRASGRERPVGTIREVSIRHADGTVIPTEIALSSWRTGGAEQFIGVFRDVSKTKQIEADLRQARDSAEHANRMKSEFLATISHEIRTPMNGVLGTLLLLGGGELAAEERRLAGIARQSAESLLRLLDDILDFSKLEAGKIAIEEETCAPSRIAEAVVDVFKPKADEKGVALSCRMLPSVPDAVVTDPARLRQILFNLVGNAIKFTSAGHVAIRARRGQDMGDDRPDGRFLLEFEVEDTGIGIRPEALPHMFDRFTQADSSITRRYGGTGLGLAICKELCGLLGGGIDVASAPGRGSLFRFSIACAPGDPADLRLDGDGMDAVVPQPALPSLRVLAVDDNPVNRDIVRAMLQRAGHSVVTATDGAEAVQIAAREPFDLVLMDIQMPGMDGLTATRLIRTLPDPARRVPVIALTAHASGSSRPECEDAGMNGFVTKPIRPAALFEEIASVLGQHAPEKGGEPAPAAETADGLLDREQVDSIRDALGPEDWGRALDGFVRTAGDHVGQIAAALEAGDGFQRVAHTLKGLAWNVGAKRLGDLALAVETATPDEARALVPELRRTLAATVESLTAAS
ncbi:PAS domain S-box protein [Azospirillum rugosum]|uniref:histidine kinase n=1 Tax=Azospirillum rugosum TaxID=416170 RepID=A0ABS4SK79_9PROT|nr:PAS domain S-box protein [Azospirillum rugosum]MBP2292925.1 PAS domain S-box-containing protein [Azospirillum rugosum]MDQ0529323.1 PAS domain S-box-containing protein [Azospirillum rugosum]